MCCKQCVDSQYLTGDQYSTALVEQPARGQIQPASCPPPAPVAATHHSLHQHLPWRVESHHDTQMPMNYTSLPGTATHQDCHWTHINTVEFHILYRFFTGLSQIIQICIFYILFNYYSFPIKEKIFNKSTKQDVNFLF